LLIQFWICEQKKVMVRKILWNLGRHQDISQRESWSCMCPRPAKLHRTKDSRFYFELSWMKTLHQKQLH
jgi:hypothetical protein